MGYARLVTEKAVSKEMGVQQDIKELEKAEVRLKKSLEGASEETTELKKRKEEFKTEKEETEKKTTEMRKKLVKEQIAGALGGKHVAADGDDTVMSREYHNRNATLMVKTIKAIAVVTTSPPVTGEMEILLDGTAVQRGSILYKSVVLREGSIGTLVEKVDDNHIKVRFPKKTPNKAPLVNRGKDEQYIMDFQPALAEGHDLSISRWMRMGEKELKKRLKKPDGVDAEDADDDDSPGAANDDLPDGSHAHEHSNENLDVLFGQFEDVLVSFEQVLEASSEWLHAETFKAQLDQQYKLEQNKLELEQSLEP